jgi:hypothetical protein
VNVFKGDSSVNIETLQQLASKIGLHRFNDYPSQKMLIHAIQKHRGRDPCFLSDKRYTCNEACEWRASCQKLMAVWLR